MPAASAGLSQGLWLSYISKELGISFLAPVCIGANNNAAVAYTNSTVKCSKIWHIDAQQDWVGIMCDSAQHLQAVEGQHQGEQIRLAHEDPWG